MSRLLLLCLLAGFAVCTNGLPLSAKNVFDPPVFASNLSDTIPPTIECPPSVTLTLGNPSECDTMYSYAVTADDDQPGFLLIQLNGLASGSAFQIGSTVNSFLVTDLSANTATCSFTVTVVQPAGGGPLLCKDTVVVELGANCAKAVLPEEGLLPPFGCLGNYRVDIDRVPPYGNGPWVPANLMFSDVGNLIAYRVVDESVGNSCFGRLRTLDPKPTLSCSPVIVHCGMSNLNPYFLRDSLGLAAGVPQVMDNCPGVTLSYIDFSEDLPCDPLTDISGLVTRFWTATDSSGNTATCQHTIVRQRSFAGIQFPEDVTVSCSLKDSIFSTGLPVLVAGNYEFKLWPTSFCEFEIQFFDTLLVSDCNNGAQYARTWKVFDLCDPISAINPYSGVQLINFVDNSGPKLTCDSSVIISATTLNCLADVDLPDVLVSDDCSPVVAVTAFWTDGFNIDSLDGTIFGNSLAVLDTAFNFPSGATTNLLYVATDNCGNSGTCQIALTVWDMSPPEALCVSAMTVALSENGSFSLAASALDSLSGDSCSLNLSFKVRRTLANECQDNSVFGDAALFCCADIGDTVELTLRVYDVPLPNGPVVPIFAEGQFSECVVQVVVLDTLPTSCIAPPDVVVSCTSFDTTFAAYSLPMLSCGVDSLEVSLDYTDFDSLCTSGVIVRTFIVFDQNGNSTSCAHQIEVEAVQEYFIKLPDDVVVTVCNPAGFYGEPTFLNNGCGLLIATYEDEVVNVVPDACFRIDRTWTIRNACNYDPDGPVIVIPNPEPNATANHPNNLAGPIVSPSGTPDPWAPSLVAVGPGQTPTDFSVFWNADANAYRYKQTIKIVDNQKPIITNCPTEALTFGDTTTNDPLLWNQSYWNDPLTNLNDVPEAEVTLSIAASDDCTGAGVSTTYLLFLDLDGNGSKETVVSSNNPPAPGTINYNNINTPNYSGGTPRVFDGRNLPPNQIYRWAVHHEISGSTRTSSVQWKTQGQLPTPGSPFGSPGESPQLPYGTHSIRWVVNDVCGNETICEYEFTVKDTQAPVVECADTLSFEITSFDIPIMLTALTALNSAEDNHTPPQLLYFGMRKVGAGSGFPEDATGNPIDTLLFDCSQLGTHDLEVWAKDRSNNTSSCTLTIHITDADSSCTPDLLTVAGNLLVSNTAVTLNATPPSGPPATLMATSDNQGNFKFENAIRAGTNYTVKPFNDENHLNGVSTFDLVLISRHILGLEELDTPYKIIAADANKNNAVTTFDVVEIRKLILGIYDKFPDNTSWRFVNKAFNFPDPKNPFFVPFPENITRNGVTEDQLNDDFEPVKVGDVNNSALYNDDDFASSDDRNEHAPLFFEVTNRAVEAGETFTVQFKASEQVSGYQFTLNTHGLETVNILPGEGMNLGNFARFDDAVTTSVENEASEFAIAFHARQSGLLSDMLSISSRITRAEGYKLEGRVGHYLNPLLRFDDGTISKIGFELYQNQPNPFRDRTLIGFQLPEGCDATLSIFDETGRLLHTQTATYSPGYHAVSIEKSRLGSGVFYYKLDTPTESATRKMVVLTP